MTIEAVSADGNRIDTDYLGANQSQSFELFTFVDDSELDCYRNATFKIGEASMY